MGEVDISLKIPDPPPINQVGVVDCRVSNFILFLFMKMFMVMREVDIGLRQATLPPQT